MGYAVCTLMESAFFPFQCPLPDTPTRRRGRSASRRICHKQEVHHRLSGNGVCHTCAVYSRSAENDLDLPYFRYWRPISQMRLN